MRVRNVRRSIAVALLAAGGILPVTAIAAPLNTNLVVNPSFEDVDAGTIVGAYGAVLILDWIGGGGAYDYSQGYDNGGPLAGGGSKYFSPNSIDGPIFQEMDVSMGPSGAAIAGGTATFNLSGYFTSYGADEDIGTATVDFLSAASVSLGTAMIQDSDGFQWTLESTSGAVPVGTAKVRLTLDAIPVTFGPDGYMDLLDFRVLSSGGGPSPDFNNNGTIGCDDVNPLVAAIVAGTNNPTFDLTGDGLVNRADLTRWLTAAGNINIGPGRSYLEGDANLDAVVDGSDFGIWNSNKFTTTPAWCSGDFNADGVVDGSDFGIWNSNKFQSSDGVSIVPEPTAIGAWWLVSLFACLLDRCFRGTSRR